MTVLLHRAHSGVATTFPLAAADRPWAHAGAVACVLGPLRPTDPDAVVAAVRAIAAVGPQTRLGLVRDGASRWTYDPAGLDRHAAELVTAAGADEAAFHELVSRRMTETHPTGDPTFPVHFLVSERWFALVNHHLLGDGHTVMRLAAAVLAVAHGGAIPKWTIDQPFPHPLRTAVWRTFGRHPGQVRAVLADRPSAVPAVPSGERDWSPSPRLVSARTTTAARRELVRWGAEHAQGASLAALALAALRTGLESHGIVLDPTSSVAINARRYLPRGAVVPGNFAARLDVAPAEPNSAVALSAAIDRATENGRPLAALAASALAGRRSRPTAPVPNTASDGVAPHLGYSYFGRPMDIERLPWDAPADERRIIGHVDPGGANQFGSLVFLIGGGLQYSVNFHDNRHDATAVRAAVEAIAADPAAVLESRRG